MAAEWLPPPACIAKAVVRIFGLLTTLLGLGILVFMSVKWDLPQGAAITATCFAAVADAIAIAGLLDVSHESKRAERALVYFGDFLALAVGIPGTILLSLNNDSFGNFYHPRPLWQGQGPPRGSSYPQRPSTEGSPRGQLNTRKLIYSITPSPTSYYSSSSTETSNPFSTGNPHKTPNSSNYPSTSPTNGSHKFPGRPYRSPWRMHWKQLNDLSQWILVAIIAWRTIFLVWACFNCIRSTRKRERPPRRDAESEPESDKELEATLEHRVPVRSGTATG